jgi:hypothetical protein
MYPHALFAAERQALKKQGLSLPKGRPQFGRDHAKIASRAQRRGRQKPPISAAIWAGKPGLFAGILEMAVGEALKRQFPALRVQKSGKQ